MRIRWRRQEWQEMGQLLAGQPPAGRFRRERAQLGQGLRRERLQLGQEPRQGRRQLQQAARPQRERQSRQERAP